MTVETKPGAQSSVPDGSKPDSPATNPFYFEEKTLFWTQKWNEVAVTVDSKEVEKFRERHEGFLKSNWRQKRFGPEFYEKLLNDPDLTANSAYIAGTIGVRKPHKDFRIQCQLYGYQLLEKAYEISSDPFHLWVIKEEYANRKPGLIEKVRKLKPDQLSDSPLARYLAREIVRAAPDAFRKVFDRSRFGPVFDKMIVNYFMAQREEYKRRREARLTAYRNVFGKEYQGKTSLTVSTAAVCFRRAQYDELDYDITSPPADKALSMLKGTAAHRVYKEAAWQLPDDVAFAEMRIPHPLIRDRQQLLEETIELRGIPDLVIPVDITERRTEKEEWQVIDYKNVRSFVWDQLKRADVPEFLRKVTKDYYEPFPADRLQVLLYMYILRQVYGLNVTLGKVLYVNKDTEEKKEAIIVWDEITEKEVEAFKQVLMQAIEQVEKAKEMLRDGEMDRDQLKDSNILHPDTPEEPWVCKGCLHLDHCPPGMENARKEIMKGKKPKPRWMRIAIDRDTKKKAREQLEMRRRLGVEDDPQAILFPYDTVVETEKK